MRGRVWHLFSGLFAVACVLLYFQIFSMDLSGLPHPDEISAFDTFLTNGFFGGVRYYWQNLIGRPSAMGWLGLPVVLSHWLGVSPWPTIVIARAFNFVAALACLTVLFKTILPRSSVFMSVAIAASLLAAVLAGVGTTALITYWLADQAIYLFSFMTYCLVLSLFWRIARNGIDKHALWLPPIFFLYVGAQEVNLVAGGLMLVLYFFLLFRLRRSEEQSFGGAAVKIMKSAYSMIPRFQGLLSSLQQRSQEEQLLFLFLVLCVVYVLAAFVQVFSPSLAFRLKVWSPSMGWLEAARIGLPAAFLPLLDLGLGLKGSVLPILLTGGVLGAWHGATHGMDRWRVWLLLCPLAFAIVISVLMALLSARYGLISIADLKVNDAAVFPDAKIYPLVKGLHLAVLASRQNIYAYQLWFTGLFFGGVLFGVLPARRGMVAESWRFFPLVGLISAVWLSITSVLSPAFADSWRFDWLGKLEAATEELRPLDRPPGFDGTRYLKELLPNVNYLRIWAGAAPKYGGYPVETALQGMFQGGPIMFVPCAVAGAAPECHVPNLPRLERRLDSAVAGLSGVWSTAAGGRASFTDGRLAFVEDKEDGEHYLATGQLAKSARTLVQVTAIIDAGDVATGTSALFNLVSPDGSAAVAFDLAQAKISGHTESGARALDGSIRRLAGASLSRWELTARFVVFGKADRFQVRLQSSRNGQTTYQGDGRSSWQVESSRIRMLDTGETALRLQPKPTEPTRLYAGKR